jgi:hypothetical protein
VFKLIGFVTVIGLGAATPLLAQGQQGWGMGPGWGQGPGWDMGQGWGQQGWGQGWGMPQGWGMGPGYGTGPSWGTGPGGGMGAGMGPGRGMMMGSLDADQSGDISAEEASAHAEAMFALMDANADGGLEAGEFGAGRMGMMNPWGMMPGMEERHAARFAAKDGDGDGKVTMAEFLAAEKAQYDAADADSDGKVTPWELRAAMWQ